MKKKFDFSRLTRSKVTWAVVAEILVLLVCLFVRPDFFNISYQPAPFSMRKGIYAKRVTLSLWSRIMAAKPSRA